MSHLPENLEKVANAGGWEGRALQLEKERQKTYKELQKIKKEQWASMTTAFKSMGEFIDKGGFGGLMSGSMERLEVQVTSELDKALAPITNELAKLLDSIFDEPFVQGIIGGFQDVITASMKTWNAIFTGQWSELTIFMQNSDLFGPAKEQALEFASYQKALFLEDWITEQTGMTYAELDASAAAGGVYSGQYDMLGLDQMIADLMNSIEGI